MPCERCRSTYDQLKEAPPSYPFCLWVRSAKLLNAHFQGKAADFRRRA